MPGKDRYTEFGKLNADDTVLGRYQDYEGMDLYTVDVVEKALTPHPLEQLAAEAPISFGEVWRGFVTSALNLVKGRVRAGR